MKNNIVTKFPLLILLIFITHSFSTAQSSPGSVDSQLTRMKNNYQAWIQTAELNELQVEFDHAPDAIDLKDPRFSWVVPFEGRGRKQSAYQIQVSSDSDLLKTGKPDMWDSGVVNSGESVQISYKGHPLQSNSEYFWHVSMRDESGIFHPYSHTERFSTAFLFPSDWEAFWIGRGAVDEVVPDVGLKTPEVRQVAADLRSPLFRKEFTLDRPVRRARLFVSGLGFYEARLNGKRIGNRVLTPSKTDYKQRILYDTYDVSSELSPGKNALGVMLGNGWFNTPQKWWGWRMQWYGSPRLILQLEISYTDGSSARIISDGTWRSGLGAVTFSCMYDGEDYDSRLEQTGWDQAGFDERKWQPANLVRSPGGLLASSMLQPQVTTETIHPISVNQPKPGVFIFDMGRNFAGWVRLRVKGNSGTQVKLRYSEAILPDGSLDCNSLGPVRAEDNYILNGVGPEVYEPHFTSHGFQYVEVTGYPGTPSPDDLEGHFIHNGIKPVGFFDCGNDLINRIHLCTVQSQRSNIQTGVPTDSPQRAERLGWTGDAMLSAQEAMFNLDMPRLYNKWIWDFHAQQVRSGLVGFIIPQPQSGIQEDLVWSAAYVMIPWWQYLQYGDRRILEDHYQSLVKYMDYLSGYGETDVKPRSADKVFLEYPRQKPLNPGYLQTSVWGDHLSLAEGFKGNSNLPLSITTAFYYHEICIMARIAEVLGKKGDVKKFNDVAGKINHAFNDRFFNVAKNSYDDGSQAAQAFALNFGLVPKGHEKAVLQTLLDDLSKKHNGHLTTGYPGTKSLIEALTEAGRADVVWQLTQINGFPGWSDMLRGRTTVVESWNGGSLNHIVLTAALDRWFYTTLAGIRIDETKPGFENIIIRPYFPKDLDRVTAWINAIRGRVESSWNVQNKILKLEITIPANSTALVYVPSRDIRNIMESGKPANKGAGVEFTGIQADCATFRIQSGHYSFSCPLNRE